MHLRTDEHQLLLRASVHRYDHRYLLTLQSVMASPTDRDAAGFAYHHAHNSHTEGYPPCQPCTTRFAISLEGDRPVCPDGRTSGRQAFVCPAHEKAQSI